MHQDQEMERPVVAGAEAGPPEGWHRRRRTARRRYATSLARRSRLRARARSSWGPRAEPEMMPMGAGRLGKWWLAHHPSPQTYGPPQGLPWLLLHSLSSLTSRSIRQGGSLLSDIYFFPHFFHLCHQSMELINQRISRNLVEIVYFKWWMLMN